MLQGSPSLAGMRASLILVALAALIAVPPAKAVDNDFEDELEASIELMQARQNIAARDFAAAEILLDAAHERTPDDPDVHSLLGLTARKQGRLEESYAHYE